MPSITELGSSVLASSLRGWRGTGNTHAARKRPETPLALYEFEACPFCRLVREALTELDLDVLIRPCPQGGQRFREQARKIGGRSLFPFLVDPNTNRHLYESGDIIDYLNANYGGTVPASKGLRRGLSILSGTAAAQVRHGHGRHARPSKVPEEPLELYSFESSPYSRLVRETLCELELPYLLHNGGKARWSDMGPPQVRDRLLHANADTSSNRATLYALTHRVQFPYLIDPNTGTAMYESDDIRDYL
ncbi:MAG: glutathione S-transferase N-terminal domain-containing protein, partial [Sinobacteraceae bacterium]|nr:glutathione S-transferase N-terminal domain-containing protein [Nevskiaceae bacterium]